MSRIGITFGCYSPLHQGHLDLIMKAKKENDKCVVIVCGSGQDREDIDIVKRHRIISNFLKNENIYTYIIDDRDLGIDESMNDSNWKIWLDKAYSLLADNIPFDSNNKYTWYFSESEYEKAIQNNTPSFYAPYTYTSLEKRNNDISGTACRTEPLKHWSKITAPFRFYYSHNILITGTASEGKTTLTEDIGKYFNIPYSYEKGRDICKLKPDTEFTAKDFIYNIYEQHKYNEELITSPWNPGVFVSDTDNVVTLMYALAYAKDKKFLLTEDDYKLIYDIAAEYMKTTKWDKIFLIKPNKAPIVDDGERYMGHSDYAIRLEFFNTLVNLYKEFGYEDKIEIINGGYYNNFITVKEYIENLYK